MQQDVSLSYKMTTFVIIFCCSDWDLILEERTRDDAMQMMKQAIKGLVWPLGIFSCQSTCILACPKVAQYGWHVWPDRNGEVFVRSIAAWNPPTIRISIYRCPARFGPTKSSGYIYVAHCTYTLTHTGAMPSLAFFLLPNTYEMNPLL